MSFEVLEKLEAKVQSAVDTISILQMEIEELKQSNSELAQTNSGLTETNAQLQQQNDQLQGEHQLWQERLRTLLGKMDEMEETV